MIRSIVILILFTVSVKFNFAQSNPQIKLKNNIGIEFAYSRIHNHFVFKEESKMFSAGKVKCIINLKYRRQFHKNLSLNLVGNYYHVTRQDLITHRYKLTFIYDFMLSNKQVSFIFLPEAHIGRKFVFFIQAGLGVGYKLFDNIENSTLHISYNDGKDPIRNTLPKLDGTHTIYKFCFGIGFRLNFKKYSLDLGYRFIKDSKIILNEEYYYMLANNSNKYIGVYIKL